MRACEHVVKSLSDLVDFWTKHVTCAELPRKKGLLLLRWTLFASLLGLGASSAQHLFDMIVVDMVLSIFLLINIALTMVPASTFHTGRKPVQLHGIPALKQTG